MTIWNDLFAANADLARYKPVFDRIRAMKPYQLSDEMEKFLHDLGVVGDAWERLFDETIAGLQFEMEGETLNIEATLNFLTEQDRSKREAAAREVSRVLGENVKTFGPRTQHPSQGKRGHRPLARYGNRPDRPPLVQPCRTRGGRGPAQRSCRGLSQTQPSLL